MLFPATGKEDSRKFPDRIYLKILSPELNPGLNEDRMSDGCSKSHLEMVRLVRFRTVSDEFLYMVGRE